jgi:carboxypeptidase family protein/TonB-dependent receptor-like protein
MSFLKVRNLPVCWILSFALLATQGLFAQGTADIVGSVTDNSGAVVPNAKVTVKNLGTNQVRTAQADAAGQYSVNLLPVGDYSVSVEAQGFKTFIANQLTIATGDKARVDAALQVGEISQTVEVAGQTIAVQTDSSTVGGLVTSRAVQDLPVNGRNFIRLVQLAPGATESVQSSLGGGTRPDDRRQTSTVSANGQNDSANNFLLDGMDNNERAIGTIIVKPSIDAQQEVKVETNMYTAESGRAGGAVINVITKSGTNKFHGTVFEFLRNDKLDAKDVLNVPQAGNALAGVKPPFRQNQYGGSIGGPIKKDKTFFFVDYEGLRRVKGNTFLATIPTACQLGRISCNGVQQVGNFSDVPGTQIFDPVTRAPFANNIISPARLNQVGLNYAALYPTLTGCAPTCNFISSPVQTQYAHTADVRIDHRFGDNDNFYARYSINNTDTASPGFLPPATVAGVTIPAPSSLNTNNFPGTAYQRQQSLALSHVHIFSPTLLLQLGAQVARYVTISESANSGVNANTAFGGPGNINTNVPGTSGLALIQFQNGGYATLGDGFALPTAYWDTNYQYTGAVTWSKGSHTIKFGSSVLDRNWSTFQILFKGNFNVNSAQTSSAATNGAGGNAFASLLTGNYNTANRNMALAAPQYKSWELGEYIQDNWRISSKLTVNLGLRYDVFTPITEKHNALSNFDPTDAATLASGRIQVAGASGVSKSVNIATQYGNLQPRVGFAYSFGRGTVLRGGFGTSFWPNNVASPANLKNAPMVATYQINTPGSLSAAVPFPVPNSVCLVAACGANTSSPGYTPSGFAVSAATQLPYHNTSVYMANLLLEKELAGNVFGVGFVAEPVRNLGRVIPNIATNVPNLAPGGCGAITGAVNLTTNTSCLPYFSQLPLVGTIQLLKTDGIANYTALQLTFQRRYSKGLSVASNYTFAKALSDSGGPGGACGGCGTVTNDAGRDYGPSDYMVKHRFTFTANYELPFGKNLKGVVAQVVKGWQVNGIYAYGTGQPFSILDGGCAQNSFGVTSCRPNVVAASSITQDNNQWFDVTQFRRQTLGTAGNLGRNTLTMPRNVRLDLSLFKDFRITESTKLQFRAEGFNVTNTPLFGIPGSTISTLVGGVPTNAGNFGRITSTNAFYTPRDIQLALKLIF